MASKSPDESEGTQSAAAAAQAGKPAATSAASTATGAAKPSSSTAKAGETETKDANENGAGKDKKNGAQGPAVTMLIEDHRAVDKLFGEYENAKEKRKREIIQSAAKALIIHTMLEEEIFYPACREAFSDEDDLDEAQVEHDGVKVLITDLLHGSPEDQYRDAKFKVLSEYVRHHVREEEGADGIFAMARKEGIDTPELAQEMRERKSEIERSGQLPQPQPRALRGGMQQSFRRQSSPRESGGEERTRGQSRYFEENDMGSYQQHRGRDDDDYGSRRGGNGGNDRPRDEEGRFMSSGRGGGGRDDDERYGRSGRGGGSQSYRDDDRGGSSSRSSRGSGGRDDDDRGRDHGQGGWFGDSRGHSEASRRGWDNPDHGRSGWFGDSDGHSEASRRGWDNPDHGRSGWFGDSEGHSEASRRGWDDRGGSRSSSGSGRGGRDDDDRGGSRSSRSRDDDDRGTSRSGRGSSRDDDDDRGHGGWFGDSRGHSEASRRGWESRR